MSKANVFTLEDLIDQGYTPEQIVQLIADIEAARNKQANTQKKAEAKKNLVAMWYAYCDTVGVPNDEDGLKFRNDILEVIIASADAVASEDVDGFLNAIMKFAR